MRNGLADREAQVFRNPGETAGFAAAMDRMHFNKPRDDRVIPAERPPTWNRSASARERCDRRPRIS